ncbi:DUF4880 domain-containing protein [Hephaestia sp. MAHUQ-44]|nr:DUF4880 domain-containing protein [Hephaestia sp. MAHUQ-44]
MESPQSERQVQDFEAWLRKSPAHLRAYQETAGVATLSEDLRLGAQEVSEPERGTAGRHRSLLAFAAALILAITGSFWFARDTSPAFAAVSNHGDAIRPVALRDGSQVLLDIGTDLKIAIPLDEHQLSVDRGRARFAIPQSHDLEIVTSEGRVIASGGLIDVAASQSEVRVLLLRGKATLVVSAGAKELDRIDLRLGQVVRLRDGKIAATPQSEADASWVASRVNFADAPLATVLAQANRFGRPLLRVADNATGKLRVTGVLDLRDTRALARKLAAALDLRVVETGETLVLAPADQAPR